MVAVWECTRIVAMTRASRLLALFMSGGSRKTTWARGGLACVLFWVCLREAGGVIEAGSGSRKSLQGGADQTVPQAPASGEPSAQQRLALKPVARRSFEEDFPQASLASGHSSPR